MATTSVTVGVDLSARDPKTWMATIDWTDGHAYARLERGVRDIQIIEAAKTAAMVGIDCPFGWPTAFVKYVRDHAEDGVEPQGQEGEVWRSALANRATDKWIKAKTDLKPLSVSADRIGHVAFRCAHLLSAMKLEGIEIDRTGRSGTVVEVYPAASLKCWGLVHKSYKRRANQKMLSELANKFFSDGKASWLEMSESDRELCRTNDDAFDAVIASLTARAQMLGLVEELPADRVATAAVEGWIALPLEGALDCLIS